MQPVSRPITKGRRRLLRAIRIMTRARLPSSRAIRIMRPERRLLRRDVRRSPRVRR